MLKKHVRGNTLKTKLLRNFGGGHPGNVTIRLLNPLNRGLSSYRSGGGNEHIILVHNPSRINEYTVAWV